MRAPSARVRVLASAGMYVEQIAVIVDEYDPAIDFFVRVLGFELVEDSPSLTNDGRPKRWVVVRPPGAQTSVLLARADGEEQTRAVGRQFAGRVGLFLRVPDFEAAYERLRAAGVQFVSDHVQHRSAASQCSSISPATAGTCWAPHRAVLERPNLGARAGGHRRPPRLSA